MVTKSYFVVELYTTFVLETPYFVIFYFIFKRDFDRWPAHFFTRQSVRHFKLFNKN